MRRDFPFYAGEPIGIGFGRWTVLLLSIVAGFMLLEFLLRGAFKSNSWRGCSSWESRLVR